MRYLVHHICCFIGLIKYQLLDSLTRFSTGGSCMYVIDFVISARK